MGNKKDTFTNIKQKEDSNMRRIKYIGISAAGNKAVMELVNREAATIGEILMVNSTDKDFPEGYTGDKIILSPNNTGWNITTHLFTNTKFFKELGVLE